MKRIQQVRADLWSAALAGFRQAQRINADTGGTDSEILGHGWDLVTAGFTLDWSEVERTDGLIMQSDTVLEFNGLT